MATALDWLCVIGVHDTQMTSQKQIIYVSFCNVVYSYRCTEDVKMLVLVTALIHFHSYALFCKIVLFILSLFQILFTTIDDGSINDDNDLKAWEIISFSIYSHVRRRDNIINWSWALTSSCGILFCSHHILTLQCIYKSTNALQNLYCEALWTLGICALYK